MKESMKSSGGRAVALGGMGASFPLVAMHDIPAVFVRPWTDEHRHECSRYIFISQKLAFPCPHACFGKCASATHLVSGGRKRNIAPRTSVLRSCMVVVSIIRKKCIHVQGNSPSQTPEILGSIKVRM